MPPETVYVVYYHADWGEDGSSQRLVGVFSTIDKALEPIQKDHDEHDLTMWGLMDYKVYECLLDQDMAWSETPLELTFDKPNHHNNKVILAPTKVPS